MRRMSSGGCQECVVFDWQPNGWRLVPRRKGTVTVPWRPVSVCSTQLQQHSNDDACERSDSMQQSLHAASVLITFRAGFSGVPPRRRLSSRSPRERSADGTTPGRSGSSSPFYSAAGSLGPAGSLLLGSAVSSETNRRAGLYGRYCGCCCVHSTVLGLLLSCSCDG